MNNKSKTKIRALVAFALISVLGFGALGNIQKARYAARKIYKETVETAKEARKDAIEQAREERKDTLETALETFKAKKKTCRVENDDNDEADNSEVGDQGDEESND